MQKKLLLLISLLITTFISVSQTPKSDFSHIEIVVDSTDFQRMVENSFVRDSLGSCFYDTLQRSPLVISYFINGLENFIHFNPNKGHFASQRGTAYLIFQSRMPGQGEVLEKQWKLFTKDSLKLYHFKGPDFLITEIVYKKHWDISHSKTNHLIPMLSSYSVTSYKKWGLGDSVEVKMKDFIGGDSSKLFTKILSVKLSMTKKELTSLTSMLNVTGYEMKGDRFIKPEEPVIFFTINEKEHDVKVKEFVIQLNKPSSNKELKFGTVIVAITENKAKFIFN